MTPSVAQIQKLLLVAGIESEDSDEYVRAFVGLGWILNLHEGFEKRLDIAQARRPKDKRNRSAEKRIRALNTLRGRLRKALESLEGQDARFDLLNAWGLWRVRNLDQETEMAWTAQWLNDNYQGNPLSDLLGTDLARVVASVRSLSDALEAHSIALRDTERFTDTVKRLAAWWEDVGNGKPGYDNHGEPAVTAFVRFASKCLETLDGLEESDAEPLYSVEVTTVLRNRASRKK